MHFATRQMAPQDRPLAPPANARARSAPVWRGNQAALRRLAPQPDRQAAGSPAPSKLTVGAVNDPLEHEADAAAARVMRMEDPAPLTQAAAGVSRKCGACDEEDKVRTKRDAAALDGSPAPAMVDQVLATPGQTLDAASRAFFEPRFGRDFGGVRVHVGTDAAASARELRARAYTVGAHIVFADGAHDPGSAAGRLLLGHELAHTVQQGAAAPRQAGPLTVRRAPALSGPVCTNPIKGDTGRFAETSAVEEENERKKSGPPVAPGVVPPCRTPRHRDPAVNVTKLVTNNGVTLPPGEIAGIFIHACTAPSVAAAINTCRAFPDGAPAGTAPAKQCIQVPLATEDNAAALLAKTTRTDAENQQIVELVSTISHEAQHAHFDANAATIVPAGTAADCDLNTVIFNGPHAGNINVEFYLSEVSAEIGEFPPFFQNNKNAPGAASQKAMFDDERQTGIGDGESIGGIITALKCKCANDTVDTFIQKVFDEATGGWPADQKLEFQSAMTRIMPSIWPKRLQKP